MPSNNKWILLPFKVCRPGYFLKSGYNSDSIPADYYQHKQCHLLLLKTRLSTVIFKKQGCFQASGAGPGEYTIV